MQDKIMARHSMLLLLLSGVFIICVYSSIILQRQCDSSGAFREFTYLTLESCVEECVRRQRCNAIMYRQTMNFCALKEHLDITKLETKAPYCIYKTQPLLQPIVSSLCSTHNCEVTERCTERNKYQYDCIRSECPAPRNIGHAYLLSNTYAIGSTNRYECASGYYPIGSPNITCGSDANWTSTNFQCKIKCPRPKTAYHNAWLTFVEGRYFEHGSVLHFTCKNDYKSNGFTKTSRCVDGAWSPSRVQCGHTRCTTFLSADCVVSTDVNTSSSHTEASAHCKSIGGNLRKVADGLKSLFTTKPSVRRVLDVRMKSWYTDRFDFAACAAINGEDVNSTGLHFDDMVNISRNWTVTNAECTYAHVWMPGQPDGEDEAQCLYRHIDGWKFDDDVCYFDQSEVGFVCAFPYPVIN